MTLVLALLSATMLGGALMAGIAMPAVTAAGTAINAGTAMFEEVPADLGFTEPSEQSVILASDGSTLARIYAMNRIVVSSDQISQHMKDAVVAVEDKRFYTHGGVDAQGLIGAFVNNISGDTVAGGSSITQQYVKNALIERGRISDDYALIDQATERSIGRKINEARYAIALEKTMTKDEILTGYMNLAQFGRSEYGLEAAAQRYFSKHAADLNIIESATLAGITQSPAKYDPAAHPEEAEERRNIVLYTMLDNGYITQEDYDAALATPVASTLRLSEPQQGCGTAGISAYFCEYVVNQALADESWGADLDDRWAKLYRGGLTIQTTIDPSMQQAAYDSITGNIPVGDDSNIKMALSSVEPNTGHIKAMAQNTDFGPGSEETGSWTTQVNLNVGYDMGGAGGRQSGSTFKLFTLMEWLRQGRTAYEVINSNSGTFAASNFNISCSPDSVDTWTMQNLEGVGGGNMSILEATRRSVNGTFVRMATQLDLCNIAKLAMDMGVQRGDADDWFYGPGMILGANEITPLSMATAMSTLAAEGNSCSPIAFTSITDNDGTVLLEKTPSCSQVIEPELARETTAVLQYVMTPGSTGENAILYGRQSAGKTGTSDLDADAWFVGYTPQLSAAIWSGHLEGNTPMLGSVINGRYYWEVYGGLFPALTFSGYMNQALADQPVAYFNAPSRNVITNPNPPRTSRPRNNTTTREPSSNQSSQNSGNSNSDSSGNSSGDNGNSSGDSGNSSGDSDSGNDSGNNDTNDSGNRNTTGGSGSDD